MKKKYVELDDVLHFVEIHIKTNQMMLEVSTNDHIRWCYQDKLEALRAVKRSLASLSAVTGEIIPYIEQELIT